MSTVMFTLACAWAALGWGVFSFGALRWRGGRRGVGWMVAGVAALILPIVVGKLVT